MERQKSQRATDEFEDRCDMKQAAFTDNFNSSNTNIYANFRNNIFISL